MSSVIYKMTGQHDLFGAIDTHLHGLDVIALTEGGPTSGRHGPYS